MERLLNGPGWRREEQRYQPPSSQRIARTPALSRGIANAASAPTSGHSLRHFSPEMPLRATNEKELLRGLNERFAGFIEKVRRLESQNKALEEEIEDIRLKAHSATSLAKQYEPELQNLRRQVREMAMQKHQMELEHKRVEDECKELIEKCEEVARSRGEAEESISVLKKCTESAYLSKQEMDRRANALAEEIEFLKTNHEAEVTDILTQMKETRVCGEVRSFGKGELTAALRDIRTQLEGRAFCSDSHSEQHYSKQLANLTKAAEKDRETLIATKTEIRQYKLQLQSKTAELDSFRGREALERQLYDLEQRHTAEIHRYQDTIRALDQELQNTKYDMNSHVQEYHDLLNVKMALDAEIYSYRKLLEGEESRYSTLSDAQIPGPYVYRQSPIYTLSSVPRVGGVSRKAEPQYKFVEEIITETTSENIEISDAGSDDAEEQRESDKVCCEKENEAVSTESEEHLEDKMSQKSDPEDYKNSLKPKHLDNEEIPTKNEEQSLKKFTDVSPDLKEDNIHTELAQNESTASEQTREKDTDHSYSNVDNIVSETKENVLDTETQEDKSDDADVEKKEKQDEAKEIDQGGIKEPQPAEKTATPDTVTEPEKSAKEEISAKSIKEKAKNETQPAAEHKGSSTGKTLENVKSVEVDTSGADSQPVPQKAEAGQETRAKSEADSMQSVEKAQADVLNTTNAVEVQKSLVEKVKTETLRNNEIKEMQPKEEKKMDQSKPETVSVKPEKKDSVQFTEEQKTQEIDSKPAAKETAEVETSGKKKVNFKTEEKVETKSSEIPKNEIKKDKETKYEQIPEKQVFKNHETSTDIKDIDKVKPEGQEIIDSIITKDGQPGQSLSKTSLEKQQEKDQTKTDKDVYEIKDTNTEKSHEIETKPDTTKIDTTTMKDFEKDPTPDSKKPESTEKDSSEKGQDNSTKADVKREQEAKAVTENGGNI
ncbi:Neurofilament medium polypeptide [Bagarius yarrelli]|uniref:Neurofilament medium polypeptide n=1 Tax=Bagarius yarrelli TaxID=175774 RepID=A0A556VB13_BAGYA|nr:Neurofilament medium polypeptide [Bagarius yarrelli]